MMTGDPRSATAADAAQLLAEWFVELGYLQHADAVQIVSDAFGDAFVATTEGGRRCLHRDVLEAFACSRAASGVDGPGAELATMTGHRIATVPDRG
jgi:hypothetical protein